MVIYAVILSQFPGKVKQILADSHLCEKLPEFPLHSDMISCIIIITYSWGGGECVIYALLCAGFGLFFLYDCNSVLWRRKIPKGFFAVGCCLTLGSSAVCLGKAWTGAMRWPWLAGGILCAGLTVYALFFALPFEKTYVHPAEKPPVYDRGMYALCRHPGVLWFCLSWLFLGLCWDRAQVWGFALTASALNIGYVVFQDVWTFPRTFENYRTYQKHVPFLIPTPGSIRRAWETRR